MARGIPVRGGWLVMVWSVPAWILVPAATATGLNSGPWPMFHRSTAHEARTTHSIPAAGNVAWSAVVSDSIEFSSPAIASDGTLYVGDVGHELWAFLPNGIEKWHFHTGGNIRYSTPAVADDGTVYIGSNDHKLYALRPNGTLRWTRLTGGPVKTSPAIAPDGTIYVGSDDGKLWAFNPNGGVKWTFTAGDTIRSSPAVGADGTVYFGSHNGNVYAVWPTGLQRWVGTTGGRVRGAPALGQGNDVIVGSEDGFLYAIRSEVGPNDGTIDWATYTGHEIRSSPAVGNSGKIYLGIGTEIQGFHDDGQPAWSFDTGERVLSTPAVHVRVDLQDVVICGSDDGKVYAILNGNPIWNATLGGPVRSSPAIGSDAHVYVGALNGRLYSIGANVPTDVGSSATGPRLRLALDPNPFRAGEDLVIRVLGPVPEEGGEAGVLVMHDAEGRAVRTLHLHHRNAVRWNGRDERGHLLAPGAYFWRYEGSVPVSSGRLIRLR